MGDESAARRDASWRWIAGSIALYAIAILIGTSQFDGKWHRVGEHWKFQHAGGKPVQCDSYVNGPSPCYLLLRSEVLYVGFWVVILPFAPLLVSILTHCQLWPAIKRLLAYIAWFGAFYAFFFAKLYVERNDGRTFDASDHVTISIVGLAVTFREVGWAHLAWQEGGKAGVWPSCRFALVVLTGVAMWATKFYFTYYTCRFFHTPKESFVGLAFGIGLSIVFWFCEGDREPQPCGRCCQRRVAAREMSLSPEDATETDAPFTCLAAE